MQWKSGTFHLCSLSAFVVCSVAIAQDIHFSEPELLNGELYGTTQVIAADLNSDGSQDLLALTYSGAFFLPASSPGFYGTVVALSIGRDFLKKAFAEDLDGDGDTDLLFCYDGYPGGRGVYYCLNVDGQGHFDAGHELAEASAHEVQLADLNRDGLPDLLTPVCWYPNTGLGLNLFASPQDLPLAGGYPCSLSCTDLNDDGLLDVLFRAPSPERLELLFGQEEPGEFQHLSLYEPNDYRISGLRVADLDGNGSVELLCFCEADSTLHCFEQNPDPPGGYSYQTILSGLVPPDGFHVLDMDQDADLDLLLEYTEGGLVWYEQSEGDYAGSHSLYDGLPGYEGRRGWNLPWPADLDGDGDLDLVLSQNIGVNLQTLMQQDWEFSLGQRLCTSLPSVEAGIVADVNLDGREELLAFSEQGDVFLLANHAAGCEGMQRCFVTEDWESGYHGDQAFVQDLDGDGDLDLLKLSIGYSSSGITCYLQNGSGVWEEQVLLDELPEYASTYWMSDLDHDGDLDCLYSPIENSLRYLENEANQGFAEAQTPTGLPAWGSLQFVEDLDGDGLPDLLLRDGSHSRLCYNVGNLQFSELRPMDWMHSLDLRVVDMDGDSDPDLTCTSGTDLHWLEYTGERWSWEDHVTEDILCNLYSEELLFSDLDSDGDLDVVATGDSLWIYRNDAGRITVAQALVQIAYDEQVFVLDFDGDGDKDLLSYAQGQLLLRFNQTSLALQPERLQPTAIVLQDCYPNPFNPATTVSFVIQQAAHLHVSVHNLRGQLIATLAEGEFLPGEHRVPFDGSALASGVYLLCLRGEGVVETRKALLVK